MRSISARNCVSLVYKVLSRLLLIFYRQKRGMVRAV